MTRRRGRPSKTSSKISMVQIRSKLTTEITEQDNKMGHGNGRFYLTSVCSVISVVLFFSAVVFRRDSSSFTIARIARDA